MRHYSPAIRVKNVAGGNGRSVAEPFSIMGMTNADRAKATQVRLADHLNEHAEMREKIVQQLLISLHSNSHVSMDAIYEQARERMGLDPATNADLADPNTSSGKMWRQEERRHIEELALEYAAHYFTPEKVDDLVNLVRKRELAHTLEHIAGLAELPFDLLAGKVREFCSLPLGSTTLSPEEAMGTRVSLVRHLISAQLEFIRVAKKFLSIRDFEPLLERTIGPINGIGKIGGKAAGMLLGYLILITGKGRKPGAYVAEGNNGPFSCPIRFPETWYLRTDLFEEFLDVNGLGGYRNQKYKNVEEIQREWPLIRQVFKNAALQPYVIERLRLILDQVGDCPLLVRSSSLLEDNFGCPFSGKYRSVFVANQGSPEHRLEELVEAVLEVFTSSLHPDPLLYRRKHDLLDFVEMMGVMIQKVVGFRHGDYYLPAWAGVAFSRNEYRWSKSILREDGLLRLVMGLGTRAVDRVGADYPRMVALTAPTMRPEVDADDIRQYSQRYVDVINLRANRFECVPLTRLLSVDEPFPCLDQIVSLHQADHMVVPPTSMVTAPPDQMVVTFDKMLRSSSFPAELKQMLRTLERAYKCPVDVEFAFDGETFFILQCRSQSQRPDVAPVVMPDDVPIERTLFSADRLVSSTDIRGIEYVVYVDPHAYDRIGSSELKSRVARAIGKLNHTLQDATFILMGPGRWGSNDINLGVRVSYADINNTKALIEIARQKDGYTPEVSYGTHFFQDLVEDSIAYVPLYPDEPGVTFNESFLHKSTNSLAKLRPDCAEFEQWIKVIDVPLHTGGERLRLVTDSVTDRGLAFIENGAL